ncbi:glycosyltransferase family 4 protein [Dysgonomonas sp. 520]|uniref:glycosyltransferase family 4 protein n=1 Tax=Dysgonomonas sp. 520 TaxID=2302931 RepID=UPI0013D46DEF|nr:glycosyltransferase family 4 protein [Dysgonomonas sp. 520]NDW08959.1 glycosyltransferase [Dysgonomonas sp. 520]
MKKLTMLYLGRQGAGPLYSFEMAKALLGKVKLQIIVSNQCDNIQDWIQFGKENESVEIYRINTYTSKLSFIISFFNFIKYWKIINQIKEFSPNSIYAPMISLFNPFIYLFFSKRKIVSTLHDPILHEGEKSIFIKFVTWACMKKSGKVIILSKFFLEHTMKHFKKKEKDICIIPHACIDYNIDRTNNQLSYKILFFGRIEKYKGIDLLLDAFSIINNQDKRISLTIAGRGDLNKYQQKIADLKNYINIQNRWIDDSEIPDLISEHDFLVLPYIDASQSGVIPMAFTCGKTVIVTNVGALSEQVPENTGIIVNPDANEIATNILNLYTNPTNIKQLEDKAYKYAHEELTWTVSAKKLCEFLSI